jgi:hypothetical protein
VDTERTMLWPAVDIGNLAKPPEARCDISSLSSMFDIEMTEMTAMAARRRLTSASSTATSVRV